jgi:hypothetical protein
LKAAGPRFIDCGACGHHPPSETIDDHQSGGELKRLSVGVITLSDIGAPGGLPPVASDTTSRAVIVSQASALATNRREHRRADPRQTGHRGRRCQVCVEKLAAFYEESLKE